MSGPAVSLVALVARLATPDTTDPWTGWRGALWDEAQLEVSIREAWYRLGESACEADAAVALGRAWGVAVPLIPARKLRLSQLSAASWGSGQDRRGVVHARCGAPLPRSARTVRATGAFVCGVADGRFSYPSDELARLRQLPPTTWASVITCPACQAGLVAAAAYQAQATRTA